LGFIGFWGFFRFLIFKKIIYFEADFYEQIRHKLSFISLDAPKSILETEKTLKTLLGKYI
jgi:hypothetical protein